MPQEQETNIERLLYSISSLVELSDSMLTPEDFMLNSKAILHQISGILLIPKSLILMLDEPDNSLYCYISRGIECGDMRIKISENEKKAMAQPDVPFRIDTEKNEFEIPKKIIGKLKDGFPEAQLWINLKFKDELLGVLILGRKFMNKEITQQDLDFLKIISRSIALTFSNFKLIRTLNQQISALTKSESELKKKKLELEILYAVGLEVTFLSQSLIDIAGKILENAVGLLDARAGALLLYDESLKKLEPAANINISPKELGEINENFPAIRYALHEKTSSIRSNQAAENDPFPDSELLTIPIIYKNEVKGIFVLIDKESRGTRDNFTEDDKKLLSAFANQAAVAIENARLYRISLEKERIQREIELAAEIQKNLIPESFPSLPGYDISGVCIPCRTVGGDYYNYFLLPDGRILIAVADVSGKGVSAALFVSSINSVLHAQIDQDYDLLKVIGILSKAIYQSITAGKYATAFFLEIDPARSRIRCINAGHNPPIMLTGDNHKIELTEGGFCIGMFKDSIYKSQELPFNKGDQILIYTDGVTEQTNEKDDYFGEEPLSDILISNINSTAAEINQRIIQSVYQFSNKKQLQDDMTLVMIKKTA
jgi:sigma-B regulation protein RsbU (phosphoserine phosphatase)